LPDSANVGVARGAAFPLVRTLLNVVGSAGLEATLPPQKAVPLPGHKEGL